MKLDYTKIVSSNSSNEITTSINSELVNESLFPTHFTDKSFRSINFVNFHDCTIKAIIDGIESTFVLKEYVGINIEDKRVSSFIVKESGVGFYFLATL